MKVKGSDGRVNLSREDAPGHLESHHIPLLPLYLETGNTCKAERTLKMTIKGQKLEGNNLPAVLDAVFGYLSTLILTTSSSGLL